MAFPDSLVGTDSHTTMIDGLGVVGWGVGGIEAEGVMLGQPIYMLLPEVVGMELTGQLGPGATATDLVLTVTEILRKEKVVGKFVEFFGPGVSTMALADRATIGNMAPEYGATMGFFPVDEQTLKYLRQTGRTKDEVELVERYTKEQGLFRTDGAAIPKFTKVVRLDLSTVEPSLAGPKRPQDRVPLSNMKPAWQQALSETYGKRCTNKGTPEGRWEGEGGHKKESRAAEPAVAPPDPGFDGVQVDWNGKKFPVKHGNVVIAAITSCTNTSNPSVMVAAGLLAKKAVEKGLKVPPHVKTSLAPGSRVVTDYFDKADLTKYLEGVGFYTVGYGCTTCIGNSGPLPEPISKAIKANDLVVAGVLSGNRNFEGRINPDVKANYLASPPLVVAYALAGTTDIDFDKRADRRRQGWLSPFTCARSGRRTPRCRRWSTSVCCPRCSPASTTTSGRRTRSGTRSRPARASCTNGRSRARTSRSRRSWSISRRRSVPSSRSTGPAAWRRWATR